MTNLSKKLCELCGIEPKIICDRPIEIECYGTLDCMECEYIKEVYPDFEQPENFVKLLEIPVDSPKNTDIKIIDIMLTSYTYIDRQTFLNQFLICLKNSFCPSHYRFNLDYIKQAIKNTEWGY